MSSHAAKLAVLFISCACWECRPDHKASTPAQNPNTAQSSPQQAPVVDEPTSTEQFTAEEMPLPFEDDSYSSTSGDKTVQITSNVLGPASGNFYVVIGGNNSCQPEIVSTPEPDFSRSQVFANFINVLNQMPASQTSNVLFLCYGDRTPNMAYYLASEPGPMRMIDENLVDNLVMQHIGPAQRIQIIGFSYGGGRAIHVAASVAATTRMPVSLYSIDPINRAICQRIADPGCRGAFSLPQEMNQILSAGVIWVNFYQGYPILRSGPFSAADINIYIDAPHNAIDNSSRVWETIAANICAQEQAQPLRCGG